MLLGTFFRVWLQTKLFVSDIPFIHLTVVEEQPTKSIEKTKIMGKID